MVFVVVQQFRAMFVHFCWGTIDVCRSSVELATLSIDFHGFLVFSYCFRVFIAEHRGFASVICRDCEMLVRVGACYLCSLCVTVIKFSLRA